MTQTSFFPYLARTATPTPDPGKGRVVVATDGQLRSVAHANRLAISAVALGLSRRKFADELALVIYGFEGDIVSANGSRFEINDTLIDDVFGDDQDFRWISDFLKWAAHPPRQRPQENILPRLRVIDLYFRIKHPDRATLIAK